MRIQSSLQFQQHCQKKLASIYLIQGEQSLLVEEQLRCLQKAAQKHGFSNEGCFQVSECFDWDYFKRQLYNQSLFSPLQWFELKLSKASLDKQGIEMLEQYCQHPPANTLLIITSGKLDRKQQKSAWINAIEKKGVFFYVYNLSEKQRLHWINQRLLSKQFSATNEAIHCIDACTEGNLLAAEQMIEKISYYYADEPERPLLDLTALQPLIEDQGHFNVFSLTNPILLGQKMQALRVLNHLKQQGQPPTLILWALVRQLRCLRALSLANVQRQPLAPIFSQYNIFTHQQSTWQTALKRYTSQYWEPLFIQCSRIDQINKGALKGDNWLGLSHIVLRMS